MILSDDDVIDLGDYAEDLLTGLTFNRLVEVFKHDAADHLLSTKPDETAKREQIYASMLALGEFLGMLQEIVQHKNDLYGRRKPQMFPVDPHDAPASPAELSDEEVFRLVDET